MAKPIRLQCNERGALGDLRSAHGRPYDFTLLETGHKVISTAHIDLKQKDPTLGDVLWVHGYSPP